LDASNVIDVEVNAEKSECMLMSPH